MAEYFPDTGFVWVEFKSRVSGDWFRIRDTFGLFPTEAQRRMEELKARHPDVEYRLH
jgi:hypothetical protein